jgi:DNA-binding NarL/FixJ family response regulator
LRPSERTIADAIVRGLSNGQIAEARGTSERTVANQVATLFQRAGVESRAELVRRLLSGGMPS